MDNAYYVVNDMSVDARYGFVDKEEPTVRGASEPLFPYALLEALREAPEPGLRARGEDRVAR